MGLPAIPIVQAYSGVSQPIRTYNQSGTSTTDSTLTLNVYEDGIIQGFLGFVDINQLDNYAPNSNYMTISITRNGNTLIQQTVNFYDFPYYRGQAFYDTLNMLSGAEVKAGEVFKIVVDVTTNANSAVNYTSGISLIIKAQARQFVI